MHFAKKAPFLSILMWAISCSASGESTSIDALESETNEKYPYFAIQLKPFVVNYGTDTTSTKTLSPAEKALVLEAYDVIRFTLNHPAFFNEYNKDHYKFQGDTNATGSQRSIKESKADPMNPETLSYYDKNVVWVMLQHAKITTFFTKNKISGDSLAQAQPGPIFYVDLDLNNPQVKGCESTNFVGNILPLHISLPDDVDWTVDYRDPFDLAGLLFHETVHNLGIGHIEKAASEDPTKALHDIFRTVIGDQGGAAARKLQQEFRDSGLAYYRTKYASYTNGTTVQQ